jgi:hypothetical protein
MFRQFGCHLQDTKEHKIKITTAGSFCFARQITDVTRNWVKVRGQPSWMVLYRCTDIKEAKSIVRGQFEFCRITKWLNLLPIISGFKRPTFITTRSSLNQQKLSEQLPTDTPADISSGLQELGFKAISLKQECPNILRQRAENVIVVWFGGRTSRNYSLWCTLLT